jgi:hypothetical protein
MTNAQRRRLRNILRRGTPSPSASNINNEILQLIHVRGPLSECELSKLMNTDMLEVAGRVGALTRLGLLQKEGEADGQGLYRLSKTGERARQLTYLSIT